MIITAAVAIMGISVPTVSVLAANSVKAQTVLQQEEVTYAKVNVEDLPETVSKSITEGYADYTVSKAFKGSDGSYKVKLEKGDEKISVFFNEQGEFLKIEQGDEVEVDPMK